MLVAQGGRFGGWSLYCLDGRLSYAYNCYGRDLTTIRAERPLTPGPHEVTMWFEYGGGPPGDAAHVTLSVDGEDVASRGAAGHHRLLLRVRRDHATWASTGAARSPTTTPRCATRFTGTIHGVRFDLDPEVELGPEVRRRMTTLIND